MHGKAFDRFVDDKLFQCVECSLDLSGCSNLYMLSATVKRVREDRIKNAQLVAQRTKQQQKYGKKQSTNLFFVTLNLQCSAWTKLPRTKLSRLIYSACHRHCDHRSRWTPDTCDFYCGMRPMKGSESALFTLVHKRKWFTCIETSSYLPATDWRNQSTQMPRLSIVCAPSM